MAILPDRFDPSSEGPKDEYLFSDDLLSTEFPSLYEYLSRVMHCGQTRKPSRLIVYGEPGRLCVCLTDPHSMQVLFHNAEGWNEAWEGLERRLAAGTQDWRPDKKARYQR